MSLRSTKFALLAAALLLVLVAGSALAQAAVASTVLPFSQNETDTGVVNTATSLATSGSVLDLLNISPGTPGYVSHFWLTTTYGTLKNQDAIIKVYVDGEGSPSVQCDLGTCFASYFNATVGRFSSAHTSQEYSTNLAPQPSYDYTFSYPIPFTSSIHITLTAGASGFDVWSRVGYQLGQTIPWKLHSSGLTWANRLVGVTPANQSDGSVVYLNLGAGNSGYVVYHEITFGNAVVNSSYLEAEMGIYLDGASMGSGTYPPAPQYGTSGMEDYFLSGFYFMAGPQSNQWMQEVATGNDRSMSIDWLALNGGIKFNNGIVIRQEGGTKGLFGGTNNVDIAYLVLYYQPTNVWSAADAFKEVLGNSRTTSSTTDTLLATDCGGEVIYTASSAVTVTIPAAIVPPAGSNCVIGINQSGAGTVSVNGSAVTAATLVNAQGYTGTGGAAGSEIGLRLTTIGSTATATLLTR